MVATRHLSLAKPPVITGIGVGVHLNGEAAAFCSDGRWRLHVYATPLTMHAEGRAWELGPGWIALWPPEVALEPRWTGRSVHTCVHFQVADAPDPVAIRAVQDLGPRHAAVDLALREAVRWFERAPHRAEARLWDVLWQLVEADAAPAADALPAALARACAFIQGRLHQELAIERIAAEARVSPNQLLRLFRRHLGATTVGWLRASRIRRAEHLLRWSDLPIKEIAAEVGIPDLHFFNKTVRAVLGAAPRDIRRAARG